MKWIVLIFIILLLPNCRKQGFSAECSSAIYQGIYEDIVKSAISYRGEEGNGKVLYIAPFLAPMDGLTLKTLSQVVHEDYIPDGMEKYGLSKGENLSFGIAQPYNGIEIKELRKDTEIKDWSMVLGIFEFSKPLLNEVGTKGVLFLRFLCGQSCGYEAFVVIERKQAKWMVVQQKEIGMY